MRLSKPRIARADAGDLDDRQKEIIANINEIARDLNLFQTMLNVPDAMTGLMGWGNYIQSKKNDLQGREKEIVILRTSYLTKSAYEWSHHARIGLEVGLTENELEALKDKKPDHQWSAADAALMAASEELVRDYFVSNATWENLTKHFPKKKCMDVVFTCAHYAQVSKIVNSFGIQVDSIGLYDEDLVDLA